MGQDPQPGHLLQQPVVERYLRLHQLVVEVVLRGP
jgi:hypothetical protein